MKLIVVFLFALGLGITQPACPGPGPNPVINAVIDCVKIEGSQAWSTVQAQLSADVAAHDWQKLVADTEALGVKFGYDTARCVAMELVQQYLLVKQTDTAGTWTGAHDAADQIRAKAGGATFHTKDGDL